MNTEYTQIISVEQLQFLLNNSEPNNLVILDASIAEIDAAKPTSPAWPEVVIAHSQRFDLKNSFSDLSSSLSCTMPNEEQFQLQARKLGINQDSQIIIYDDKGIYSAPRAWWMFKSMGLNKVAVLNGGMPEWVNKGGKTNRANVNQSINRGNLSVNYQKRFFCDKDRVQQALSLKGEVIIDARASGRFSGDIQDPRSGVRNGHIPDSLNLPFKDLLHQNKLLPNRELKRKLTNYISHNDKVIFSCGSGITACVLALAADICGYQQLTVYDGSWSDWGSDHRLPIS